MSSAEIFQFNKIGNKIKEIKTELKPKKLTPEICINVHYNRTEIKLKLLIKWLQLLYFYMNF